MGVEPTANSLKGVLMSGHKAQYTVKLPQMQLTRRVIEYNLATWKCIHCNSSVEKRPFKGPPKGKAKGYKGFFYCPKCQKRVTKGNQIFWK